MRHAIAPALLAIASAAVVGCGGQSQLDVEKQDTVPASGIISYRGKPLAEADVTFVSADGKVSARGRTDAAGLFTLTTYEENDGAPPGLYKVLVAHNPYVEELDDGILAPLPDEEGEADFTDRKKREGPAIPEKYGLLDETPLSEQVSADGPNQFKIEVK